MKLAVATAALAMLASTAVAEDNFDMVDFLVDWPKMIGERVHLQGQVISASEDFMMLHIPPENITLKGWRDREDLRYLFRNCTGLFTDKSKCTMGVVGTVTKSNIGDQLQLTDVDFEIPGQ